MTATERRGGGRQREVVPPAEPRTYYDQPVLKEPAWTVEVPWYFFFGGLAGASSLLAVAAERTGDERAARAARLAAAAGAAASPLLLIKDLGRPGRFLYMLRVVKITSPLNVGSWLLVGYAPLAVGAAVLEEWGRWSALRRAASWAAAVLGPAVSSYTAVLVANTAIPVWHEARRELPFVFVGSSAAAAGGAAVLGSGGRRGSGVARNTALAGAALDLASVEVMEQRLGDLAEPYEDGTAGRWATAAKACTALGAATLATSGRRRTQAAVGGALLVGGSLCQRFSVYAAGFQSARDPKTVVGPQRERLRQR